MGTPQPHASNPPRAACTGAGIPAGSAGAGGGGGEGRTRRSPPAIPLPRPRGFSVPQSRQRPPASACAPGRCPQRALDAATPPEVGRDGGKAGTALPRLDTQPHSEWDREATDGLIKHPVFATRLGPRWSRATCPAAPGSPRLVLPPRPAGGFEPPRSGQAGATPQAPRAPRAGPVPACPRRRARAGDDAGAGGAAASGGAGSAPRPPPPPRVTGGRGRQRTCPLLWKTAGSKAAPCSPGLRCQRWLGPRQPAQPSPGRQRCRQPAAGGGPGGLKPVGASLGAQCVPQPCAHHPAAGLPARALTSSDDRRCWSLALLNPPQTGAVRPGCGEGARRDAPGMAPSSGTASTGGPRSWGGAGEGVLGVGVPGATRCLPTGSLGSPRCLSFPWCLSFPSVPQSPQVPSLPIPLGVRLSRFLGVTPPAPRVRRCLSKDGETEARHPPGQTAGETGGDGGCWGPGRASRTAPGERGGDPARGQGDVPPPREASRGRRRRSHVASQPKPPWGSKEGKCFMELEKKKALPTGPSAASSSARPCVSAAPRGWPVPPSPAPGTWGGLRLRGRWGWSGAESQGFAPPQPRGPSRDALWGRRQLAPPGALRETEAGDAPAPAARHSPWGGQAAPAQHRPPSTGEARAGPPKPSWAEAGALSSALAPDAEGFISLPTYF